MPAFFLPNVLHFNYDVTQFNKLYKWILTLKKNIMNTKLKNLFTYISFMECASNIEGELWFPVNLETEKKSLKGEALQKLLNLEQWLLKNEFIFKRILEDGQTIYKSIAI